MLSWEKLLCDYRVGHNGDAHGPSPAEKFRSPFESDWDRILYSSAFRRLARKTQVHPHAVHDHVHNRLTHSLEVASVGRTFARLLGKLLVEQGQLPPNRCVEDLVWIMQSACLGHDIGNPPFGHAGEHAIREWSTNNLETIISNTKANVSASSLLDWMSFEGNAQGFRICARPDNLNSTGYVRMTFASLGAMVKYPWCANDPRSGKKVKFCAYRTETKLLQEIWDHLGLLQDDKTIRHPMSFLTEAADDICYHILDVEDAVAMRLNTNEEAIDFFKEIPGVDDNDSCLEVLRGKAIKALINSYWKSFLEQYNTIVSGKFSGPLANFLDAKTSSAMSSIAENYKRIFSERYKIATELGAYKSLGRVVKAMSSASLSLAASGVFDEISFAEKKIIELTWGADFAKSNQSKSADWWLAYTRDYIAGMTDNYATQLSREIEGV